MKSKTFSILIAPNAFKHSLNAGDVARLIGEGIAASKCNATLHYFPIGDGGDGTIDLIAKHFHAERIYKTVNGPLGTPVNACYGLLREKKLALIEMANASGISLLDRQALRPMQASSYGTGQLILEALNEGAQHIIIGMGGSATIDGGCGILAALGARFYDRAGKALQGIPEELIHLERIDLEGLDRRLKTTDITILCDVRNKLLGKEGAASVFGPQKGATASDIQKLEVFLQRISMHLKQLTGLDMTSIEGGGVAGGAAAGLYAALKANLKSGIDHFMELTDFDQILAESDLLITGEGSLDSQTLGGKGPYGVALKAKKRNIPVIAVAGKVPLSEETSMRAVFDIVLAIGNEPMVLEDALKACAANLIRTGTLIGNFLQLKALI